MGRLGGGGHGPDASFRKSSALTQPLPGPPLPSQGREQNEKAGRPSPRGERGFAEKAGGKGVHGPMCRIGRARREESRVGNKGVRTGRSRGRTEQYKKRKKER